MSAPHQHRLQIATRIHDFLMRELGQGVDVEKMLKRAPYARDVLLVCDACRGTELTDLAQQFRQVTAAAQPGHQPHGLAWSKDTSGFGVGDLSARGAPAPARLVRRWWQRLLPR